MEIPNTVQDALKVPKWKKVVFKEMKALEKNGTWELIDLPRGKTIVGCKWMFTVKYKFDGSLEQYKALVAKGFTQTYGINYLETFALVAKLNSIRVLLSLVANLEWSLQQSAKKMHLSMESWRKKCTWMHPHDFMKSLAQRFAN